MENKQKIYTREDFVNWGKQGNKKATKNNGKNPVLIRWDKAKKLSTDSGKKS